MRFLRLFPLSSFFESRFYFSQHQSGDTSSCFITTSWISFLWLHWLQQVEGFYLLQVVDVHIIESVGLFCRYPSVHIIPMGSLGHSSHLGMLLSRPDQDNLRHFTSMRPCGTPIDFCHIQQLQFLHPAPQHSYSKGGLQSDAVKILSPKFGIKA